MSVDRDERERLYTARWYSKEILSKSAEPAIRLLAVEQMAELTALIGDDPAKPDPAPSAIGSKLDHYPEAKQLGDIMRTHGPYPSGYPRGAIVHYTSGRDSAENTIRDGVTNGYAYLCIQKDGVVYQAHPISKFGYHAGKSSWPGLGDGVSAKLVGIEMNNGSELEKQSDGRFKTWFGTYVDPENVRHVDDNANQHRGYYEKYTPAQEASLIKLLFWLKSQAPDVFSFDYVLGHDEVAPTRKSDPGGALSMTMPEFRATLKKLYPGH
jgi:hypothetical protein